MKRDSSFKRRVALAILAFLLIAISVPDLSVEAASNANLKEAQARYGVSDSRVIKAKNVSGLLSALSTAGSKATSGSKYIVYCPGGKNYSLSGTLKVPKNVILVAEGDTTFAPKNSLTQMFTVAGSVYGGTYHCNNKVNYGLRFAEVSFDGGKGGKSGNGWIIKANIDKATKFGIVAFRPATKYCYVTDCTVRDCGKSGISACEGAWMAVVRNCTVTGCKEGGVNLCNSHINIIDKCVLKNNGGHGISTDVEDEYKNVKAYCKINRVTGNIITGNGKNGVYLDVGCKVRDLFSRNTIESNGMNGLSVDKNGSVGMIAKNTFNKNKGSNLRVNRGNVKIGNSNSFTRATEHGIRIVDGGKVTIAGKKNNISYNAKNGINMIEKSSLNMTSGTGTRIQGNGNSGVRIDGGSTAALLNITFANNGGSSVKVVGGAKLTSYKGCNI